MSETNNNILQAIDTIVSQRLNELNFDSTIVCEIISDANKAEGEYIVSNGDSRFTAYSDSTYIIGQKVYVTIPQNNFALKKIIVGPYSTDKTKAYELVMPFENFIDVTGNLAAAGNPSDGLSLTTTGDEQETAKLEINPLSYETLEEFGPLKYIALGATITTKMPEVYEGRYGLKLELYTSLEEGALPSHSFVFQSSEFYGNPYYYDEGFEVEKLFAYPAGEKFSKAVITLYSGPFENEGKGKLIKVSDIYLAFGYDQEDFDETSFKISLDGEQDFSYGLSPSPRIIKAALIKYFDETKSSRQLNVENKEYSLSWFRYKTGTPDFGGGKHWEILYSYNKNLSIEGNTVEYWLGGPKTDTSKNTPFDNLIKEKNRLIKDTAKVPEEGAENYDELKSEYDENVIKLNNINTQIKNIIKEIEQSIGEVFTTGQSYIGKYGDNQYRVIAFPYTNYQRDQIKAVATLDDKEMVSNILTFEFTGTAPKDISDAETKSTLQLSIAGNHLAYYPVYGENNSKIESYKGEGQTITASFSDNTNIKDVESFIWSAAPGGLVTLGAAADNKSETINFNLPELYVPSKAKTTIYCTAKMKNGEEITGSITITLGRYGSSGTDFTLSLVDENNKPASNFLKVGEANKKVFKAYLVDSNNQPVELDGQGEKIKWEWVYKQPNTTDEENPQPTLIKGLNESSGNEEAAVIQKTLYCPELKDYCNAILKVTYKSFNVAEKHDVDLVCYHPIAVTDIEGDVTLTGAIEVLYDNNGNLINCDNSTYSLITKDESIFVPASEDQIILYKENNNVILPTLVPQTEGQGDDKKIISYSLSAVESIQLQSEIPYCSVTIKQTVTNEEEEITYQWQQPIHVRYNTYGTELLNEWDDENLVVDKENNTIMASAYVAGTKNNINEFTGVVMGEVGKFIEIAKESKQGIFGYKEGKQTFRIDEDGDAYFGGKVEVADYCKIDPENGAFQVGRTETARMEIGTENILEGLNIIVGTNFIDEQSKTINKGQFQLQQGIIEYSDTTTEVEKEREVNNLERIGVFGADLGGYQDGITTVYINNYRAGGGVNTTGADLGPWHNQVFKIKSAEGFKVNFKPNPTAGYRNSIFISNNYPGDGFLGTSGAWSVRNYLGESDSISVPSNNQNCYLIRHTQRCDVADYPPTLGGSHIEKYIVTEGSVTGTGQRVVIQPNGYFNSFNGKLEYCTLENCKGDLNSNSDQNLKNSITPLTASYLNLLKSIKPVSYKYNNGTSDRLHTGFIAQQVEEALTANNLTSQDFAALVLDKNTGHYGLRYDEFIALNTLAIQDLYKYIELLEARIRELEKKESEQ